MSDFAQQGLISTLQHLNGSNDRDIERELCRASAERPVTLVLPCHFSELSQQALAHILDEISRVKFLHEVIVSMNGVSAECFLVARNYFARLPQPHRIIWNDGPRIESAFEEIAHPIRHGKGRNVWTAFGLAAAESPHGIIVTQDCDVASFRRDTLTRLCFACAHPQTGYEFSKMYYSRITDRIYGRVNRLFLAPLLHSLVRVAGHQPLLDFLLSFRYPLSGEYAVTARLAAAVPVESGWGLEIGLLCEIFRRANPRDVCQVDGGGNYEHKHQPLGEPGSGLARMCEEIAAALFSQLIEEGLPVSETFLDVVHSSYARESADALRRYKHLALINGLPFHESEENAAVELFSHALRHSAGKLLRAAPATTLPKWECVAPALVSIFREAVEQDNAR